MEHWWSVSNHSRRGARKIKAYKNKRYDVSQQIPLRAEKFRRTYLISNLDSFIILVNS